MSRSSKPTGDARILCTDDRVINTEYITANERRRLTSPGEAEWVTGRDAAGRGSLGQGGPVVSPSPYVTDPAELLARRTAAETRTVESRTKRLATTLADLGLPALAAKVLKPNPATILPFVRAELSKRRDVSSATGSNADVSAYRTALDECGALWCVL